ncbi:sulfotransferase domain-containing protein [Rhizohabitans arisaemae]|uniref:sulfotransferase domain-containing protein n=1 Tax=Rhizohabitans arisaemae TaxID=2720610 RepID=UPI0024B20DCB|nr:sulfotransferase domain-containing protein [Rhizohabitans arisaemae]
MNTLNRYKDHAPRWAKDLANAATRAYGIRTAARRHLPDFLVIGTKRGGSTSMWNYLTQHPLVMPMFPASRGLKSPWYFSVNLAKGDNWYRSHFATEREIEAVAARHGHRPLTGEACPYYLYDPRIPALVRERMPAVKLVVLLRDPVKRAYSHYWEAVGKGVEPLTFEEALAEEFDRLRGEPERMALDPHYHSLPHDYLSYRDRGIYRPQLEQWFALFPRDRFLIMSAESLYADEQAGFDRVTDFLGLPRHRLTTVERHNRLPAPPMAEATRVRLTDFYRSHNRELYTLLGEDFGWPA